MVQFSPQLQVRLVDRLHKQEFSSLLIDVLLDIMQTHLYSCVGLGANA
jgi:hypothetical protein